ncbi:sirohydrochlorin chelatase [Brachybacterium sacelli]|uniref:Sirohydrochlorin ferrochelatase n=1 Tax=Brachybacterium sacelli TaxID=173364 RepID=A0ABS4X6D9_9MICO|nr:CbiX/SirB N-terminal domain-containing protein [Brachybacterium sacelli]MBP2384045.1 sirohydrochlorin ferrochelatase [Brachybacterium sacelli]
MTALIACSHGTRSRAGRATINALLEAVAVELPEVRIEPAFVDVELPAVGDVVARLAADGPAVVVPLLLSTGHHTRVDIAGAVDPYPHVIAAAPMGPHRLLAEALVRRLAELPGGDPGRRAGDHVVLAAAGSSDPPAAAAAERMCELLQEELPVPVTTGFGAGRGPTLREAVAAARAAGARRVIAASHLLAPGHFAGLVARSGADLWTAPLGTDPAVVALVAQRFQEAADVTV